MKNRLKALRKEKGLTLYDIEEKTGIKRATYNNYETGKTEPKIATWRKLADYFGVTTAYLQGLSDIKTEDELLEKAIGDERLYRELKKSQELAIDASNQLTDAVKTSLKGKKNILDFAIRVSKLKTGYNQITINGTNDIVTAINARLDGHKPSKKEIKDAQDALDILLDPDNKHGWPDNN